MRFEISLFNTNIVIDQFFNGPRKVRIYGSKDVAKAARQNEYSPAITAYNADSYAQFAMGMQCIFPH
jgi:hypothetical protein